MGYAFLVLKPQPEQVLTGSCLVVVPYQWRLGFWFSIDGHMARRLILRLLVFGKCSPGRL